MEKYITYIGFFSGFCTTVAFVPQAYKVWKTIGKLKALKIFLYGCF